MIEEKIVETSASVDKSIIVLKQLCKNPFEYRITELSNLTKINRTTLYRILNSLEKKGMVIRTKEDRNYKLGPLVYEMGSIYLNNFNFRDKIFPILDRISHETKESVGFAVLENEKVISLYEIEIEQPLKMHYRPGIFYPPNRGCYGKCLMAYFDKTRAEEIVRSHKYDKICKNTITKHEEILKEYEKIRNQGYVISVNETFPLAVGVGIPIFNKDNSVTTCVAISFLKEENYEEKIEVLKKILFKNKDEITKYMV